MKFVARIHRQMPIHSGVYFGEEVKAIANTKGSVIQF